MFAWLENTPVAMWVGLSLWAYPMLLAVHIIGLAIVVGIFSMRDLRLLGMFQGLRPAAFLPLSRLAWGGFIVNAVSGILLFTSQAVTFASSIPFLIKITGIIVGMVLAGVIQARLRTEISLQSPEVRPGRGTRILALASLTCWLTAIVAGRLIAYF
ncbi:MAG: hypothetical protein R3F41_14500 [Gammaproteobacteria bacterium]|nr:hypothetical protein [Pseudomonadales bacterium]MCP5347188.1 hypothetical protein [Pseudomonadales bacterium]